MSATQKSFGKNNGSEILNSLNTQELKTMYYVLLLQLFRKMTPTQKRKFRMLVLNNNFLNKISLNALNGGTLKRGGAGTQMSHYPKIFIFAACLLYLFLSASALSTSALNSSNQNSSKQINEVFKKLEASEYSVVSYTGFEEEIDPNSPVFTVDPVIITMLTSLGTSPVKYETIYQEVKKTFANANGEGFTAILEKFKKDAVEFDLPAPLRFGVLALERRLVIPMSALQANTKINELIQELNLKNEKIFPDANPTKFLKDFNKIIEDQTKLSAMSINSNSKIELDIGKLVNTASFYLETKALTNHFIYFSNKVGEKRDEIIQKENAISATNNKDREVQKEINSMKESQEKNMKDAIAAENAAEEELKTYNYSEIAEAEKTESDWNNLSNLQKLEIIKVLPRIPNPNIHKFKKMFKNNKKFILYVILGALTILYGKKALLKLKEMVEMRKRIKTNHPVLKPGSPISNANALSAPTPSALTPSAPTPSAPTPSAPYIDLGLDYDSDDLNSSRYNITQNRDLTATQKKMKETSLPEGTINTFTEYIKGLGKKSNATNTKPVVKPPTSNADFLNNAAKNKPNDIRDAMGFSQFGTPRSSTPKKNRDKP